MQNTKRYLLFLETEQTCKDSALKIGCKKILPIRFEIQNNTGSLYENPSLRLHIKKLLTKCDRKALSSSMALIIPSGCFFQKELSSEGAGRSDTR